MPERLQAPRPRADSVRILVMKPRLRLRRELILRLVRSFAPCVGLKYPFGILTRETHPQGVMRKGRESAAARAGIQLSGLLVVE
jgi:hypothetical protein